MSYIVFRKTQCVMETPLLLLLMQIIVGENNQISLIGISLLFYLKFTFFTFSLETCSDQSVSRHLGSICDIIMLFYVFFFY